MILFNNFDIYFFLHQVTPNQAIHSTPHLGSTAGPSSFLTGPPRLLPLSRLKLLLLSHLQLRPSHRFSPAWCPLTTPMPHLTPLLRPHP